MKTFRELGISDQILKSIEERFKEPSEIQEKSIPLVLSGKDVIAESATGSGKTLAFGAGIIQNAEKGQGLQSLILTPTRELAEQVANSLKSFSKYKPLNILSIYGGVSIHPQIDNLPNADVVVGTPGRIIDHIDRKTIDLSKIKILVLDEADRMVDMGFIKDVEKIVGECPKEKQTLLFSATISGDIDYLAGRYMHDPVDVSTEPFVDPTKLTQVYYDVQDGLKFSLLVYLIQQEKPGTIMVFCNTQKNTDFVAKNLKFAGINALAIHGGFTQDKRSRVMQQFHSKEVSVLVCTDVAARGLDIKEVSHVYNYDIPTDSNQYIHRIGRTARAGKEGKAISILASRDYDNFSKILRDSEGVIQQEKTPYIPRLRIRWMEKPKHLRDRNGRNNGWRDNNRSNDSRNHNTGHRSHHSRAKNGLRRRTRD